MVCQKQNVRLALRQFRKRNLENVQAVIKVFAEFSVLHHGFDVFAGAGDEPHVTALDNVAAEALETLFLNELQKFDLRRERQVCDFVQEKSSAVSLLRLADVPVGGSRERSALKTEKFAFE